MDLISLGGYIPPDSPTTYKVTLSDIDSEGTGRSEDGIMSRERIRDGVYKIQLGFTNINSLTLSNIVEAINSEKINVNFFFGEMKTADMYCGDRTIDLKAIENNTSFWDISFNLIEF